MEYIVYLSGMIIPFVILIIVFAGVIKKKPVYDDFVNGAKEGMKTVVDILPTLIGLMIGVGVLRSSGFLDFLGNKVLSFVSMVFHFPKELIPLSIVRLFSSSAATGLSLDIFEQYGTDSFIGMSASLLMSCTETVFYTMSVYFIAAKVTKTRWTLFGALVCSLTGIIASVIIAALLKN